MRKSIEHVKRTASLSREIRHHQIHLNRISDEKLHQNLKNLYKEYQLTNKRFKETQKLEQQRQQLLNITISQLSNERQRHPLSINRLIINEKTSEIFY